MKNTVVLLCSAFGLILSASTAMAKSSLEKNPLTDCYVQSGPQTKAEALKIPNDLLEKKISMNPNATGAFSTGFNLKYDAKAQKISLSDNQEFEDMAATEADVIVQLGRYNGEVYASLDTMFGSSYTRFAHSNGSTLFLQHVNTIKDNYADIRVTCTYQE